MKSPWIKADYHNIKKKPRREILYPSYSSITQVNSNNVTELALSDKTHRELSSSSTAQHFSLFYHMYSTFTVWFYLSDLINHFLQQVTAGKHTARYIPSTKHQPELTS